ncbi:MAG: sigma-54-dependent Fis family transcriptional regulator [Myxococcales bacterium]|jgi:DNA-binding NtrC family response regulator
MSVLVAASGPRIGARFDVGLECVIGRSPSCDIALPEDGRVSRRHARVEARDGVLFVVDLGSRNGTFVNGSRIEGEARLEPGDSLLVGDSLFVLDPPLRASVAESASPAESGAIEEFMPAAGETAALFRASMALLGASSEAAALRRGAEEAMRLLDADVAAALLPSEVGFVTSAVIGATELEVPRPLLKAALERREGALSDTTAAAPLWAGGSAFGALYVARGEEPVSAHELGLLGMLGRMCGEAVATCRARRPARPDSVLVGTNRAFRRVVGQVRRAAGGSQTVLLCGEPGAGKQLLGSYLHARSERALGPLVVVDCRAPAPVLEEELFGRPAAPGAPPLLSALARADGGTLLLSGLDGLPRDLSARLARAIHQRSAPLPGGGEASSDLRVVATCRPRVPGAPAKAILEPELAAALEGEEIEVCPLRERRSDLQLLFDFFAGQAARVLGGSLPRLSPEARELMHAYGWPGNVRELRLCAERLAQLRPGEEVLIQHLPGEIAGVLAVEGESLADQVARLERDAIAQALRRARGKKIRAAALLGISRPTLDKKIAAYRLAAKRGLS